MLKSGRREDKSWREDLKNRRNIWSADYHAQTDEYGSFGQLFSVTRHYDPAEKISLSKRFTPVAGVSASNNCCFGPRKEFYAKPSSTCQNVNLLGRNVYVYAYCLTQWGHIGPKRRYTHSASSLWRSKLMSTPVDDGWTERHRRSAANKAFLVISFVLNDPKHSMNASDVDVGPPDHLIRQCDGSRRSYSRWRSRRCWWWFWTFPQLVHVEMLLL